MRVDHQHASESRGYVYISIYIIWLDHGRARRIQSYVVSGGILALIDRENKKLNLLLFLLTYFYDEDVFPHALY